MELSSPEPSVEIRYATDGTGPSAETPKYTGAVELARGTIVRAIALKPGFVPSKLASRELEPARSRP